MVDVGSIDLVDIRHKLGSTWKEATPLGEDSFVFDGPFRRIIISIDPVSDPEHVWIHASVSYVDNPNRIPSYADLKQMHAAVFGDGHAYQCFVPPSEHINITNNVLHLFGRLDGEPALPPFGRESTI